MIDVCYFSGMGHCEALARDCAARLGVEARPIGEGETGESVLVVFPVYCQQIPPPVVLFLRQLRAKRVALVAVYGGMSYGRVLYDAQRLLVNGAIAGAYLPAGHSFLQDGSCPQSALLAPLLKKLASGGEGKIRIPKTPRHIFARFAPAWRSRVGGKLTAGEACDGCNACGAACPMKTMRAGRAGRDCIRCLQCVRVCPKGALTLRLTPVLKRYLRRRRREEILVFV